MKKNNLTWTVRDLQEKIDQIEFPEYQREPSVWNLDRKQKLIDSMLRGFDISNIYLNKRNDAVYECIDGRQRINAILSFLGLNDDKESNERSANRMDNNFKFVSSDELLGTQGLQAWNNKRFEDFKGDDELADPILNYQFNVVEISLDDEDKDELLNLMFLRLQLGAHLNAGEKLKAMRGDMRDLIFGELGPYAYFSEILQIPNRRFAMELTASQIALNFYSKAKNDEFHRARFADLQDFFKERSKFTDPDLVLAIKLKERLNEIYQYLNNQNVELRNRAMGISVFFFMNELIESNMAGQIIEFINFLKLFMETLKEQVKKGIDIDPNYRDLLRFQNYISQAAVEKYAIENRHKFLEDYYEYYLLNNEIKTTGSN
ncbi:DUF262 domain-containing protein [Inquilinus sp. KBS0705]|nr:DUF262 domain-containing protein [Inquilinus sp. KBS0705]